MFSQCSVSLTSVCAATPGCNTSNGCDTPNGCYRQMGVIGRSVKLHSMQVSEIQALGAQINTCVLDWSVSGVERVN